MAANKSTTPTTPAAAPAVKAPALDFGSIAVETVETMPSRDVNAKVKGTPVYGWMKDSNDSGKGMAVTIPEAQVKAMTNLIRQAANLLKCGAKIVVSKPDDKGNVRLAFTAKPRRAYAARTPKS